MDLLRERLPGTWDVRLSGGEAVADGPPILSTTTVEPLFGGVFLLLRTTVEHSLFPDSVSLLGHEVMHYTDARGVARLLAVTITADGWELRRETADMSPLPFRQRFEARFTSADAIASSWWRTTSPEGDDWVLDFDGAWTRVR